MKIMRRQWLLGLLCSNVDLYNNLCTVEYVINRPPYVSTKRCLKLELEVTEEGVLLSWSFN